MTDPSEAGDDAMAADLVADPADEAAIDSIWDDIRAAGGIEEWKRQQEAKAAKPAEAS